MTQPAELTLEQALATLYGTVRQMKQPALNADEFDQLQKCAQVLAKTIEDNKQLQDRISVLESVERNGEPRFDASEEIESV